MVKLTGDKKDENVSSNSQVSSMGHLISVFSSCVLLVFLFLLHKNHCVLHLAGFGSNDLGRYVKINGKHIIHQLYN